MDPNFSYQYQPLESERPIRLLQINHRRASPRWKFWKRRAPYLGLVHVPLDDSPPYEAVSYAWGDTTRYKELPVTNGGNIPITKSVFEAIPYLVDGSETGFLWLDQICIDQDDLEERGHQVALMRDVYRGAARTLIWLGLEDRETRLAVSILEELWVQVRATGFEYQGQGPTIKLVEAFDFVCNADENGNFSTKNRPTTERVINDLIARPWFRRGWIVQELALSKAPVAFIGRYALDWDAIWMSTMIAYQRCSLNEFDGVNRTYTLEMIRGKFSRSVEGNDYASMDALALCRIIWICSSDLVTTDPRDCIFAYLGFWRLEGFEPDYRASISEVYTGFTRHIVDNVGFLDILSACHGLAEPQSNDYHGLPSWTPNFAESSRTNSLILDRGLYWDIAWDASASRHHRGPENANAKELHVFGKVFDHVEDVSLLPAGDARDSLFYQNFRNRGQQWMGRREFLELVVDANHCGCDRAYSFSFEDLDALHEVYRGQPLSEDKRVTMEGSQPSWIQTDMSNLLRGCSKYLGFMNLTKTAGGRFGFTRAEVEPGDATVILHGARIPYVLRKTEDPSKYQLVGPCYIKGVMFGEAVDWEEDEAERFILI